MCIFGIFGGYILNFIKNNLLKFKPYINITDI